MRKRYDKPQVALLSRVPGTILAASPCWGGGTGDGNSGETGGMIGGNPDDILGTQRMNSWENDWCSEE